jgi:hypothetical protein
VAAQHQLLVSCGLNVLATLPVISGLQQLVIKKAKANTGHAFHIEVIFIIPDF